MTATVSNAITLWRQGKLQEAERACRDLLAVNPEDSAAWHTRGLVALSQREFPLAIESLSRSVALQGASVPLLCDLGAAWAMSGRPDSAAEHFLRAIELDSQSATAWNNLGNAHKACGRSVEALNAYQNAVSLSEPGLAIPSPSQDSTHVSALYNLGNLLQDLGEFAKAIEHYGRALSLAPRRIDVLTNLGNALKLNRQEGEAIEIYRRAMGLNPERLRPR